MCPSTGLSIPKGPRAANKGSSAIPPVPVVPRPAVKAPQVRGLVGRIIGDKYRVLGLLGEGGMGAVYEAEHTTIGRPVAVKVLHPKNAQNKDAVSRMHHEARVVGTIGHPNICEIYDIGRLDDASPYLVMERLYGETVAERLLRGGALPYVELVDIMVQVLSALVVAHEKGIIHRDLKPDNIFLSQRAGMPPIAKLLDFGISKASNIDDSAVDITRTGMVMGTPYYMAPEQARGDRRLDHRVDLWAVGVILYEGLTGRRPFVARNYNALLVQILTSRHRPVAELVTGLPEALSATIDKLLAKMREDRIQTAMEVQERLMDVRRNARSVPPVSSHASPPPEARFGQGRGLLTRGATLGKRQPDAETPPFTVLPAHSSSPPPPAPAPPSSGPGVMVAVPSRGAEQDRRPQAIVDSKRIVARQIIDIPAPHPSEPPSFDDRPTLPRIEGTQVMSERPRRPVVPSFVHDEGTSDDATVVLPRRAVPHGVPTFPAVVLPRPPAKAEPEAHEGALLEDTTQHDPTIEDYDADATIVESPSFLDDDAHDSAKRLEQGR